MDGTAQKGHCSGLRNIGQGLPVWDGLSEMGKGNILTFANHPVKVMQEGVGCLQGDFGVRIKKSGDEQGKSDVIKGRGHIEGVGLVRPTE